MFKTRKGQFITILLGLLFVLALAACGSAAASSQTTLTSGDTSVAGVAVTSEASSAASQSASASAKLNLNTASAQGFLNIPGVGDRMVNEFLEYRPYTSILQFEREIGKYVSADQVAEYEQYVYVPISANDSDAATLQQIPGLDDTEVAALIAARPYASNDAFLNQLAQYVSTDQLVSAKTYLEEQ